jgi:small subunit ribosomal protein S17
MVSEVESMQKKERKAKTGQVVGRTGDKSIKVAIDYIVSHPKYGKYIRRRTTLGVHDENNKAGVGDVVQITESRPYSKSKRWRLVSVVEKAIEK